MAITGNSIPIADYRISPPKAFSNRFRHAFDIYSKGTGPFDYDGERIGRTKKFQRKRMRSWMRWGRFYGVARCARS